MDPILGQVILFAGNFAPRGWALCDGRLLSIAQHTAVFSILGTTYGGNGTTTFALPDLRGRVPVGAGQGAELTRIVEGETVGTESVTILHSNMPPHSHQLRCSNEFASDDHPGGRFLGASPGDRGFYDENANTTMNPASLSVEGGGQPISIMQPSLGMNYIIALEGVFPSRD